MRRLVSWLAGVAIVAVLLRALRRLRRRADETALAPADPAAELRRSLDAARTAEEATPDAAARSGPSLDERRERVHAKAQEAIELMRDGDREPR